MKFELTEAEAAIIAKVMSYIVRESRHTPHTSKLFVCGNGSNLILEKAEKEIFDEIARRWLKELNK